MGTQRRRPSAHFVWLAVCGLPSSSIGGGTGAADGRLWKPGQLIRSRTTTHGGRQYGYGDSLNMDEWIVAVTNNTSSSWYDGWDVVGMNERDGGAEKGAMIRGTTFNGNSWRQNLRKETTSMTIVKDNWACLIGLWRPLQTLHIKSLSGEFVPVAVNGLFLSFIGWPALGSKTGVQCMLSIYR